MHILFVALFVIRLLKHVWHMNILTWYIIRSIRSTILEYVDLNIYIHVYIHILQVNRHSNANIYTYMYMQIQIHNLINMLYLFWIFKHTYIIFMRSMSSTEGLSILYRLCITCALVGNVLGERILWYFVLFWHLVCLDQYEDWWSSALYSLPG